MDKPNAERKSRIYLVVPPSWKMPGLGLLRSKKLPDTVLFGAQDGLFGAEGIRIQPVKPLKQWRVEFEGVMQ